MEKHSEKRIIVSVTNDLVADNRVHKVCSTLQKMGFGVLLVGRKLHKNPGLENRSYAIKRFRLLFNEGPLFYAFFNLRLFLFLLFSKSDVLLSNDLDTLPANYLAARLRKKPLVYDSHEYFTEVPELVNRPGVQRIWQWLEKKMVPDLKSAYTVCASIAHFYTEKYGTSFEVVRNVPRANNRTPNISEKEESVEKTILYQGALNVHRGLEHAIRSMKYLDGCRFILAGDGDIKKELEELAKKEGVSSKVQFLGRLPIKELSRITPTADLGLSIEEDVGLNYRYALPNKLFDYIQAEVPVLVTNLPEMAAIVYQYKIGEMTKSLEPQELAKKMRGALFDEQKRKEWKKNLKIAATELTWEKEEEKLKAIFSRFLMSKP